MSDFEKQYMISGRNVRTVRVELNGARFPDAIPSEKDQKKKVSQENFAAILDCPVDSIRSIEQGRRPLSEKLAEKISAIAEHPASVEWLMGNSEYRTEDEKLLLQSEQSRNKFVSGIMRARKEDEYMFAGLTLLAKLNGYTITPPALDGVHDLDLALAAIKAGYSIEKDGVAISLSLEEMNALENHVTDMVEAQLDFLFKLKGGSQNG